EARALSESRTALPSAALAHRDALPVSGLDLEKARILRDSEYHVPGAAELGEADAPLRRRGGCRRRWGGAFLHPHGHGRLTLLAHHGDDPRDESPADRGAAADHDPVSQAHALPPRAAAAAHCAQNAPRCPPAAPAPPRRALPEAARAAPRAESPRSRAPA